MKKEIRGFIAGILVAGVVAGSVGTASAVVGRLQANLDYNNIKISLNGQTVTPKDANGNTVEPFAINGTTYLPVRALGDALGLDVQWNSETSTVILSGTTGDGWMTSGEAVDFVGYILDGNIYKGFCDTARSLQTAAQSMSAGEALITSGLLSSSSVSQIKKDAADNVADLENNVELSRSFIDISYSDNSTMNSILSDLEHAVSALKTASEKMGKYDTSFTDNYSTALSYANNAVQKADSAYSEQMDFMLQVCYNGAPVDVVNNTVEPSSTKTQTQTNQSHETTSRDTGSSSSHESQSGNTDRENNSSSGVDLNTQYAADRAAIDAAHQSEMEKLQAELEEAEANLATAGYRMPEGSQKDIVVNIAQQNYENANKAIEKAEQEYQEQLDELNSNYGIE